MHSKRKLVAWLLVIVLVASIPIVAARMRSTPFRLKGLPGPVDTLVVEWIEGSGVYTVTITLDNGVDVFTFDMEINEEEPIESNTQNLYC